MKHYKLDKNDARRWTRRDRVEEEKSAREDGYYSYSELQILPISVIQPEKVWNLGRIEKIRVAIREDIPLPAIHVSQNASGKYDISDGIHRYNASLEAGFSHIPAIVSVVVQTPEKKAAPEPEKPVLPVGTWVILRDPPRGTEPWAMVEEYLYPKSWKGAKLHMYGLVGFRKGEGDFIGDYLDIHFDPASQPPPVGIREAILSWYGWKTIPTGHIVRASLPEETLMIPQASRVAHRHLTAARPSPDAVLKTLRRLSPESFRWLNHLPDPRSTSSRRPGGWMVVENHLIPTWNDHPAVPVYHERGRGSPYLWVTRSLQDALKFWGLMDVAQRVENADKIRSEQEYQRKQQEMDDAEQAYAKRQEVFRQEANAIVRRLEAEPRNESIHPVNINGITISAGNNYDWDITPLADGRWLVTPRSRGSVTTSDPVDYILKQIR